MESQKKMHFRDFLTLWRSPGRRNPDAPNDPVDLPAARLLVGAVARVKFVPREWRQCAEDRSALKLADEERGHDTPEENRDVLALAAAWDDLRPLLDEADARNLPRDADLWARLSGAIRRTIDEADADEEFDLADELALLLRTVGIFGVRAREDEEERRRRRERRLPRRSSR
jgi:hypothetical protein